MPTPSVHRKLVKVQDSEYSAWSLPSQKELADLITFREQHRDHRQRNAPTKITVRLGQTGIGVKITITCSGCGDALDVSDYDHW